ncbi:hypothetical protein LOTGIDRAFT_153827 [Lottia gigantea]|uniref:SMB domain-containing protein n=1 Tax=Lottia gigantea TaxID=225164 RepID=V4BRB1_LOTGI|nr:hypothetical protein LOTGIDRAFT_153827 [Lottia gigantea]ESO91389.1 hypothetical protein LOTGIDRAFT_153827 [Lottia gigantea]
MSFSYGIVVLVLGSICQCSAELPTEDFFNLTFTACPPICVNKCFKDPTKLTDFNVRLCQCDPDCILFGDCCISFYTFCFIFRHPSDNIEFIKSKRDREKQTEEEKKISDFKNKAQCEGFILSDHSAVNLLAIANCPTEYPEGDIKDKCTGNKTAFPLDIPVSIPALSYWLFKNVYCALCNNFTLNDVLYWKTEIQCYIRLYDDIITVEQFTDYKPAVPCKTMVTLPDDSIKVRVCNPDLKPRNTEIAQDLQNSSRHENTATMPTSQNSNESMSYTNQGENQNFTQNGNISLPNQDSEELKNTVSTPLPFLPFGLPNISIDALTQANLDVLCNAYMYEYTSRENGSVTKYFNPHCRAFEVGWQNFDRNERIQCELTAGGVFNRVPLGSRLVRFQFGIFGKYIYFYSMESKSLLTNSYPKCSAEKYFEFVTKSCELFSCAQNYSAYYLNCMPTFLLINDTTFRHNPMQSTLYAKTNVVLTTSDVKTFQQATDYVLDAFADSGLNVYRPENIYHSTILPLDIHIDSLEIVRLATLTYPEMGSVEFVPGLLKADLVIPVLFNDFNQTISNLREGSLTDSTLVSNYPDDRNLVCYHGSRVTYQNLDLNVLQKRAFVEIDGILVDLVETMFTLRITRLNPIHVVTVTVCRSLLLSSNTQGQFVPKPNEQCDNLTSQLSQFSLTNGSLKLSDKIIIPNGDFFIKGDKVDICSRALKGNTLLADYRSLRAIFKNVASATSMLLKILAFIISLISRDDNPGTVYFQSLGMTCTLIDFIHLLDSLSFHNSDEVLAVFLHLAWLLVAYSFCAWCINMVCCNSKRTLKCLSRHFFISFAAPVMTILLCATGDINTPPWNIGYGSTGKIFSAQLKVVLYSYIIPFAIGITCVLMCHIYRLARRKSYKKNKSFYSRHILVTSVLTLQFGFGCSEALSELSVYYFLYFSSSVLVAWSFLLIACHGLRKPKSRLSNPSRYLQSTNNNPHSEPIQSKPQE